MRFCLVSEAGVPDESRELLSDACADRGIPFETVIAKSFDFNPARRLAPGDLLYRAAVSVAGARTEQFLYAPGVATFHSDPGGVYFAAENQTILAEGAGVPMPRTVYLASSAAALLEKQVERVGGFPVVVKVLGRSSGIGVMRADSMPALRSLVDFSLAQGHNPLLCEFVRDALHWRVVVLGGKAIASYRNRPIPNDFRTCGTTDPADFDAPPPPAVVEAALRATAACRLDFAGVDVLEAPSGAVYFLEANFPCYYPHAQLYGGVDIAGRMVDFLVAKAGHAPQPDRAAALEVRRLAEKPDLFVIDDFADESECAAILREAVRLAPSVQTKHDRTGFSFEMPIGGDETLRRLTGRIHRLTGMGNDGPQTLRFRRYSPGESHPLHSDAYEINGRSLVTTAILYLDEPQAGGETHFPFAEPAPIRVAPKRGRLAVWFSYRPDGSLDPAARHESLPVFSGEKATLTEFAYRTPADHAALRARAFRT